MFEDSTEAFTGTLQTAVSADERCIAGTNGSGTMPGVLPDPVDAAVMVVEEVLIP